MNNRKPVGMLTVDGKIYTLKFDFQLMANLELELHAPWKEIAANLNDISKLGMSDWLAMFFCALRPHHPEMSLEAAGDLMDAAGGLAVVAPELANTMMRDLPAVNGVAA